jgi:muconolactone delta-isomerase
MADQMPDDPRRRLRASDADRDRTAALLREHHAVGRLTAEEFDERLSQVFPARTLGELDELLADLPAIDLYQLPAAGIRSPKGGGPRRRGLPRS